MVKYLMEIDDDVWRAFHIVSKIMGLKIKESTKQAIVEFITNHEVEQINVDVKVIQDTKRNLLSFIYEEQIRGQLQAILSAKKRDAPQPFINKLKKETLETLKKHPALPQDLADEVVTVFKNLT